MAQDTDKELVRRVKRGDRAAFDLLFSRYQHKIHNLVARYVRDSEEVLDVTQEAFIKAFRALPKFRGDSQFYTWLYRIAINTAKNHLVAKGRRPPGVDVDVSDGEFMDAVRPAAKESERSRRRRWRATELSAGDRRSDCRFAGRSAQRGHVCGNLMVMSYEEIANIMECPVGTVRSAAFSERGRPSTRGSGRMLERVGLRK